MNRIDELLSIDVAQIFRRGLAKYRGRSHIRLQRFGCFTSKRFLLDSVKLLQFRRYMKNPAS